MFFSAKAPILAKKKEIFVEKPGPLRKDSLLLRKISVVLVAVFTVA